MSGGDRRLASETSGQRWTARPPGGTRPEDRAGARLRTLAALELPGDIALEKIRRRIVSNLGRRAPRSARRHWILAVAGAGLLLVTGSALAGRLWHLWPSPATVLIAPSKPPPVSTTRRAHGTHGSSSREAPALAPSIAAIPAAVSAPPLRAPAVISHPSSEPNKLSPPIPVERNQPPAFVEQRTGVEQPRSAPVARFALIMGSNKQVERLALVEHAAPSERAAVATRPAVDRPFLPAPPAKSLAPATQPLPAPAAPTVVGSIRAPTAESVVGLPKPSEEEALLGRALAALRQRHQIGEALQLLAEYEHSYPHGVLRGEATLARIEAQLAHGDRPALLRLLDGLSLPTIPRATEAQVLRGELRSNVERWSEALSDFEAVQSRALPPALGERAIYGQVACLLRLNRGSEARAAAARYLERYPSGRFAPDMRNLAPAPTRPSR